MTRIVRQIVISYIPKGALFLSLPVILKILTNNLSVTEYGSYNIIYSLGNFLFFFAAFGIHRYLAKIIPGQNREQQYKCFVDMIVFEALIFIIVMLLVSFFISPLSKILNIATYKTISLMFWWGSIFYLLFNEMLRFFGLQKRWELKSLFSVSEKPLFLIILLCLFSLSALNLVNIFASYISIYIFLFLIGLFFFRKSKVKTVKLKRAFCEIYKKIPIIFTFFLIDLFFKIKDLLPRYFLSAVNNNELVGFFAFSDTYAKIFYLIANPFIFVLYPYLASNYNKDKIKKTNLNKDKENVKFYKLSRISSSLSLYLYSSLAFMGYFFKDDLIVLLSNKDYLATKNTLIFFFLNYLMVIVIAFLQPIFILKYEIKKFWQCFLSFVIINILLSWFLIKGLSFCGAVFSVLITNLLFVLFLGIKLRGFIKKVFYFKDILNFIMYISIILFISLLMKIILPHAFYLNISIMLTIVLITFCIFRKKDLKFLLSREVKLWLK
jgi:O-antigen/teichoic acid export membrane protein